MKQSSTINLKVFSTSKAAEAEDPPALRSPLLYDLFTQDSLPTWLEKTKKPYFSYKSGNSTFLKTIPLRYHNSIVKKSLFPHLPIFQLSTFTNSINGNG